MSFWINRNVFVTGGTGLLGSALAARLVELGASVTCLVRDRVPQSNLWQSAATEKIRVVHGGLEDGELLLRALNEYEADTVFHLGAQTIVGTASRSTLSTFEVNVRGTWNLLEACRRLGTLVERIVVASSDKAYGDSEIVPYTEDLPLLGRYPYDASKACAEIVAQSFRHTYQTPLTIVRCGNLYGPGDLNFNRLIPGTIRSALDGERPIIRSDGQYLRDYLYVEDAAGAYLRLAESMDDSSVVGEAFNFGNEQPVSVLEVVNLILEIVDGPSLEPKILNEASHEIRKQYLDCSKARRVLDWRPEFSLREGLERTIPWYRQHLATRCGKS